MTPLVPLRRTAQTDAERIVAVAATVPPRSVDATTWDAVMDRQQQRKREGRLMLAFALSVACGIALVTGVRSATLDAPNEFAPSAVAEWNLQSDGVAQLRAGRLDVHSTRSARVETPHVILEAHQARFSAEVLTSGTVVTVDSGEVVMRVGEKSLVVHAGESVQWPQVPSIPAALLEVPAPVTPARCSGGALDAQRTCLQVEAAGNSLDAQAALFELGAFESEHGRSAQAIDAWTTSLERFPEGVLHPEVRLRLLVELVQARQFDRARAQATEFAKCCRDDPRLSDVEALRASLPVR